MPSLDAAIDKVATITADPAADELKLIVGGSPAKHAGDNRIDLLIIRPSLLFGLQPGRNLVIAVRHVLARVVILQFLYLRLGLR